MNEYTQKLYEFLSSKDSQFAKKYASVEDFENRLQDKEYASNLHAFLSSKDSNFKKKYQTVDAFYDRVKKKEKSTAPTQEEEPTFTTTGGTTQQQQPPSQQGTQQPISSDNRVTQGLNVLKQANQEFAQQEIEQGGVVPYSEQPQTVSFRQPTRDERLEKISQDVRGLEEEKKRNANYYLLLNQDLQDEQKRIETQRAAYEEYAQARNIPAVVNLPENAYTQEKINKLNEFASKALGKDVVVFNSDGTPNEQKQAVDEYIGFVSYIDDRNKQDDIIKQSRKEAEDVGVFKRTKAYTSQLYQSLRGITDPVLLFSERALADAGFIDLETYYSEKEGIEFESAVTSYRNKLLMGINPENVDKSSTELLANGEIVDGLASLMTESISQIPQLALMAVTGGSYGMAMLGISTSARHYVDVADRPDLTLSEKIGQSVVLGAAEYFSERILNADVRALRGEATSKGLMGLIKQGAEEGFEEFSVAMIEQAINYANNGEFNVYAVADAAALGFGMGSGIGVARAVATNGASALGSYLTAKKRKELEQRYTELNNELKNNKNLSVNDKINILAALRENINEYNNLIKSDAAFYETMSIEDITNIVNLNQRINQKLLDAKKSNSDVVKKQILDEAARLVNEKQSIEQKYSNQQVTNQEVTATPPTQETTTQQAEPQKVEGENLSQKSTTIATEKTERASVKIAKNEPINEVELSDAIDEAYSALDAIEKDGTMSNEDKSIMSSLIEDEIQKLENYDNITTTETRKVAEEKTVRTVKKTPRKTTPTREKDFVGKKAVFSDNKGGGGTGTISIVETPDGREYYVLETPSRPVYETVGAKSEGETTTRKVKKVDELGKTFVLGETSNAFKNATVNKDAEGNPTSVTFKNKLGTQVTVKDADIARDVELEQMKQEEYDEQVFEETYIEFVGEEKVEVKKPKTSNTQTKQQAPKESAKPSTEATKEEVEDVTALVKAGKEFEETEVLFAEYKSEMNKQTKKAKKANSIFAKKNWTDRQANIRRIIVEEGGKFVEALMTTRAGVRAFADRQFLELEKNIYGELDIIEESYLDAILFHERVIQIDKRKDVKGEPRIKHPKNFNKERSEAYLEELKDVIGEEKYKKLRGRADMYFKAFNDMLKKTHDNGLISDALYDSIKDDKYVPRQFLHHLFDVGGSNTSTQTYGLRANQIKALGEGSESAIMLDSRLLLNAGLRSTESRIHANKANLALNEIIKKNKASELGKEANYERGRNGEIKTDKYGNKVVQEADAGYENVNFFVEGKRDAFQMPKDLFEQWQDVERKFDSFDPFLRKVLLTGVLKQFATAQNPLFFLSNVPMDYTNVLMFTDVYDDTNLFVSSAKLMRDFSKMAANISAIKAKEEFSKKDSSKDLSETQKLFSEFVSHGGMMEFLSIYGKPEEITQRDREAARGVVHKQWSKGKKMVHNTLSFTGEVSEIAMRLAVYNKVKSDEIKKAGGISKLSEKQLDDIMYFAAAKARKTMDFAQGGLFTKKIDSFVPYFNAAMQGFRVAGSYIASDPKKFALKVGQMAIPVAAYMLYNMAIGDDDDWDNIPEYEKNMYFIFFLQNKSEDGKRGYIRIRKNPQIAPFVNAIEWAMEGSIAKMLGKEWKPKESKAERLFDSINDALPIPVNPKDLPSKMPPTVQALFTYFANYDAFRNETISWEKEQGLLPEVEGKYDEHISLFFKEIGGVSSKVFGEEDALSPKRTQAAIEKLITTPSTNAIVGLAYSLADNLVALTTEVPESQMSRYVDGSDIFKNMGRKVYRETNPNYSKFSNDKSKIIEAEQKTKRFEIKREIKNMVKEEKDFAAIKEIIKNNEDLTAGEKKSYIDYARDAVKFEKSKKETPYFYDFMDIKYSDNTEAQAALFGYYFGYPEIDSEEYIQLKKDMKKYVNFTHSKRFKEAYKKVLEEKNSK